MRERHSGTHKIDRWHMDCRTNNEMEASRKPIKDLQIATRYLYIVNTEHKTQTLGGGCNFGNMLQNAFDFDF